MYRNEWYIQKNTKHAFNSSKLKTAMKQNNNNNNINQTSKKKKKILFQIVNKRRDKIDGQILPLFDLIVKQSLLEQIIVFFSVFLFCFDCYCRCLLYVVVIIPNNFGNT